MFDAIFGPEDTLRIFARFQARLPEVQWRLLESGAGLSGFTIATDRLLTDAEVQAALTITREVIPGLETPTISANPNQASGADDP